MRIGNIISVSGTAPISEDGSAAFPADVYKQTQRCLEIIHKAITDSGGQLKDVIRTRTYLTNINQWEQAAKAHGEYFSDIRPASTFVEGKGFINPD